MYQENDLVFVGKRENNNKRGYLLVNPLQGKHYPVSPSTCLQLFVDLATCVSDGYPQEKVLYIGFAETATAIGAGVAIQNGGYYLQTTREPIEGVDFFFFTESHSHATEQKLSRTDLEAILPQVDRVMFVEDEVTTGNTILHIVKLLREAYPTAPPIGVLSILNGMTEEALAVYETEGIALYYLLKTDHSNYPQIADGFTPNGVVHPTPTEDCIAPHSIDCTLSYVNTRRGCQGKLYQEACEDLWQWVAREKLVEKQSVLLLGTEEFMFPPLYVGKRLEDLGHQVKFHATTRSPIAVSGDSGYPLKERYSLQSVYDRQRETFLYDIPLMEQVLVFTDSSEEMSGSLVAVLQQRGYEHITVVRWKQG